MKHVLATGAAAGLMSLAIASPAYAGSNATSTHQGASKVTFLHDGDKFQVCDTSLDGYNVYGQFTYVRIDGSLQRGSHYVSTGNSTCKTFDHDFGEGRIVNFTACVDFLVTDSCESPWREGIA